MSISIFDPVQINEAFIKIIDYNFKDEVKHFEETYSKEGFHGFGKLVKSLKLMILMKIGGMNALLVFIFSLQEKWL